MIQSTFLNSPIRRKANYVVFHDESEPVANKGWLLIGLLFVKEEDFQGVEERLKYYRKKENYDGEVHFCKLPKSFGGDFGSKARLAREWMKAYQESVKNDALFTCLAVNRASPRFEYRRFKENFHVYNRFTAMAIKAGVSRLLHPLNYEFIELKIVSDGKNRKSRPDQGITDNFEEYLPYRVELDNFIVNLTNKRSHPIVKIREIQTISSDGNDLIQLTDLLLGSIQASILGLSNRPVKRELARMVSSWYYDLQLPYRKQQYKMYRKFNIWGFPDDHGRPFDRFSMKVSPNSPEQLSFL